MKKNKHEGSSFDDYLKEEGIYDEVNKASSEKGTLYVDTKLENEALKKRIAELEIQNSRFKEVIVDNELQDEVEVDCSSMEERICINGINHIAQLVEAQDYDKNDVANFQIMFNILRAIRGKAPAGNKKVKSADVGKLLQIVEKGK